MLAKVMAVCRSEEKGTEEEEMEKQILGKCKCGARMSSMEMHISNPVGSAETNVIHGLHF